MFTLKHLASGKWKNIFLSLRNMRINSKWSNEVGWYYISLCIIGIRQHSVLEGATGKGKSGPSQSLRGWLQALADLLLTEFWCEGCILGWILEVSGFIEKLFWDKVTQSRGRECAPDSKEKRHWVPGSHFCWISIPQAIFLHMIFFLVN